ncbi:NAD(P)-binding domain-containing protein [Puia sp.]|jgi:pyrroline-5-carboxylate reductase|uniref:NAD(P)-binding domain-containing protein n=1 Tax=Puia sp. TaxID=2045100 RepID=UPI002F42DFA4
MKIGFIGVGKIAGALVEGLCTSAAKDIVIYLSPRNEENSLGLAGKYPALVHRMGTNQEVLDRSDIVFISVRPAVAAEVLGALRFDRRHIVVSLVPLLSYAGLAAAVAPAVDLARAIPLPTVMQHNCPIPLYRANDTVVRLFSYVGQPLPVKDEGQLHVIWTLTGLITPFYELLDTLSDWTTTHGVPRETANAYIANMFQSLSYLAQHSDPIEFRELAQHAATPNGMNEQAGKEIREKGAHQAYKEASDRLLERFK